MYYIYLKQEDLEKIFQDEYLSNMLIEEILNIVNESKNLERPIKFVFEKTNKKEDDLINELVKNNKIYSFDLVAKKLWNDLESNLDLNNNDIKKENELLYKFYYDLKEEIISFKNKNSLNESKNLESPIKFVSEKTNKKEDDLINELVKNNKIDSFELVTNKLWNDFKNNLASNNNDIKKENELLYKFYFNLKKEIISFKNKNSLNESLKNTINYFLNYEDIFVNNIKLTKNLKIFGFSNPKEIDISLVEFQKVDNLYELLLKLEELFNKNFDVDHYIKKISFAENDYDTKFIFNRLYDKNNLIQKEHLDEIIIDQIKNQFYVFWKENEFDLFKKFYECIFEKIKNNIEKTELHERFLSNWKEIKKFTFDLNNIDYYSILKLIYDLKGF